MASATTTYDIKVRYLLDDKASAKVAQLGKEAKAATKGTDGLGRSLGRLAGIGAGLLSFRLAKKYLVDYNTSLEQSKIQMSGLLQLNMKGDWTRNLARAGWLMEKFKDDAKKSTATTKDFVDFASLVTGPLSRAGASIEQIRDVTKGGVIAARAFGVEGEVAARDIEQALAGTLSSKDRFARALLEPMGITTIEWNKLVKETPAKAAEMLTKAFDQPAIKKMAEEQEKSWAGITSTLEDNLQRALGAVGVPLMQKMSAEMDKVNRWFTDNPKRVEEIVNNISDGLVKAFEMAKGIFGFIIEHKDLLLMLAKAYLVGKAVGGVAGFVGGTLENIGKFGKSMKGIPEKLGKFGSSIGALVSKAGAFAQMTLLAGKLTLFAGGAGAFAMKLGAASLALGAFALAANAVANGILRKQEERIERTTTGGNLREQGRLLGTGGTGVGIGANVSRGLEARAARLGIKGDASRSTGGILGGVAAGQRATGTGGFSGGEQVAAMDVVRGAVERGFISQGSSKITGAQLSKLSGNFGIRDAGLGGGAMEAMLASKVGSGKTIPEILSSIKSLNETYQIDAADRMAEFLQGLQLANEVDRRARFGLEMQNASTFNQEFLTSIAKQGDERSKLLTGMRETWGDLLVDMRMLAEDNKGDFLGTLQGFGGLLVNGLSSAVGTTDVSKDKGSGVTGNKNTNVTISKIEVVTDDPDRFAYALVGAFEDYVGSPTQAARALRD